MTDVIASYLPVSQTLLDDARAFDPMPRFRRDVLRDFTAQEYGEDWSSAEAELARLERTHHKWDRRYWPDEECCYDC